MALIAAIYVRISLDRHGEEAGIGRQEQDCRDLCARLGFEAGEVYADNDLSATSGVVRPAFERLLADRPEVIVCWHTDRFVRLVRELERVIDLDVNVHAVHAGHLDLSTHSGRMVARILTAVAQNEGEQKAARQRAALRQKAHSGKPMWPHKPLGYTMAGETIPEEHEALRQAYSAVLKGSSLTAIASDLNELGLRTWTGGKWGAVQTGRTLRNPIYAGIATYQGEEVGKGQWEAVVPEHTFRRARRMLDRNNRRTPSGRNLLSGLALCGTCGITVTSSTARGTEYYRCRKGHVNHPLEEVEGIVVRRAVEALGEREVREYWLTPTEPGDDNLEAEKATLEERLRGLADAYATGAITLDQLVTGTEGIKARIAAIDAEVSKSSRWSSVSEILGDYDVIWDQVDTLKPDQLRALLGSVFEEVKLLPVGQGRKNTRRSDYIITTTRGAK